MELGKVNINNSIVAGLVIWLLLGAGAGSAGTLTSVKVTIAPVIDGTPEAVWDQASAMTVNVAGGANTGSHTVTLKSVYTDDSVYFLAQWNDPTESLRRMPWQKQANGSWNVLQTPDAKEGGENTYYEDKFAQIWNINMPSFDAQGCIATCHVGENSDVKDYGNKYAPNPGETGDIWHMKIVRTNPTGYIDDQFLDSTRYNKTSAPEAGRHSDPGVVPYYNNINAARNAPNYTSPTQPAQINKTYWIFDDQKQPFNDTYRANDEIAAIIARPPTGDRADIQGKAVYTDGKWTMEYGRKLTTGSQNDVQFSDMKKEYSFGTAIFDNAQVRHSYESGVSKLVFTEATPTATTPAATTPAPTPTEAPAFEIAFAIGALLVALLVRRRY
ncbi:ethylbenzene dehydrogenase-related protein [Candidatus Methanoperedens nitratireducens]|uniref:Ethylbenzene dehydrogenase n=1 Tax=Candidatus Methanoperedens nitratireducens TaxID=1392998 RepID=A0A284VQ59_9EURY|nr:ethylbenzene dehydrogenase-related protein [Candidatus Methanoperedens nitroreducens]SNQ61333.1 Ethylbenzene dehydrogenase [Candidatus Methanoperedens nitroreducens]